jgi:RimJ/RimL family protein N-acetyltransferase
MTFVPLNTERLILRALTASDAGDLFRYRSDPRVNQFQFWVPRSIGEVKEFLEHAIAKTVGIPGTWFQLGICLRGSGELLGDCGIHFPEHEPQQVEIGISLAPEHQGHGYASEALRRLFDYIFEEIGMHRVFASVDPANTASLKLLDRLGMRQEAHFVESVYFKGHWVDDVIYGVLDREWKARVKENR